MQTCFSVKELQMYGISFNHCSALVNIPEAVLMLQAAWPDGSLF